MYKKTLSIAIVLAAIALLATASATNLTCTPPAPFISVIQGGNTAIVSGGNFKPCHLVNIYLDDVELPYVGDAATPQGSFTAIIVVPGATPLGTHLVKVTDDFGHVATAPIVIVSLKGADGADGKDGRDGVDGKDGADGLNGIDGKDGINGTNGVDGKDGMNGTNGIDGLNGRDGVNGTNGTNGANGTNGKDGKDGLNGSTGTRGLTGATGETGEQGRVGIQGPAGQDGKDGVTTIVNQGIQTPIVPIEVWGAMLIGAMLLFGVCVLVVVKTKKGVA